MNRLLANVERLRFLILACILLVTPVAIDLQIALGAGPETKFRFVEYGVLLSALFSIPLWCAGRSSLRLNGTTSAIGLWIVYLSIRAAFDSHRAFAFDGAFRHISWLLFILLTADACTTQRDFIRLLWIAVIGQLGPVALAVGNIFGVDIYLNWIKQLPWRWENPLIGTDRAVIWSSLGNPNYYASYGAMLFMLTVTWLFLSRRWWSRSLLFLYALTILTTLVYTYTRGIWVSLLPASFGILLLLAYRHIRIHASIWSIVSGYGKSALVTIAVLVVLGSALFVLESNEGPLHKTANRFQHGLQLRDTSLRSRPLLWYAALRMWREKPLWGQGIGRYSPLFLETAYQTAQETDPHRIQHVTREMNTIRTDQAHNDYLQILAETGLVGYALWIFFLLSLLSQALPGFFRLGGSPARLKLLTGCMAVVFMTAIQAAYDFPLLLPSSILLFSLAAAGILVLTRDWIPPAPYRFSIARVGISLVLLFIIVSGGILVLNHLLASHNLDKGSRFLDNGIRDIQQSRFENAYTNLRLAEPYLQRANRLYPGNGMVLFDLGRLLASQDKLQGDSRLRLRAIDHILRANETYCVPESYSLLCELYLDESRYAQAQRMSDILLVIDPERRGVNFLAARVDMETGRVSEAERHLRREKRLHPDNSDAIAMLGKIVQDRKNDLAEAAALFEQYLERIPQSVDVQERLADIQMQWSEYTKAREHYETALEGVRALSLRDMEKRIQMKLGELERRLNQQEGRTNDSGNK